MASYVPIIKNGANGAILYAALVSQANTKIMQVNPTLAAGDFKVSIDGGALASLTTLPTVTPAAGRMIKITLSQAEVNGDNITIQCVDAAGAEWCDLVINIQTAARQIDDLATPTNITAGTITTVTNLTNAPTVGDLTAAMKTSVTTAATAATPTAAAVTGAVGSVTGLTASNLDTTVSSRLSTAGYTAPPSAATIAQAVWDALTSALTTIGSVGKMIVTNLDAVISTRLATSGYTAPLDAAATRTAVGLATASLDTQLSDINSKTTNLPAAPAATGDIPTANANADALLDRAAGVETNRTPRQALRLMLAAIAGKASGLAGATATYRDTNDTKDRIVATVDASGNRTAVTLDGT